MSEPTSTLTNPAASEALDALTGGAFSAATSSERCACVQRWLETGPDAQQMHEVYKELSQRDKGAAKLLKEKLDEIKRGKVEEALIQQWLDKAQPLLDLPRINIADAMAWSRDAAKAGAPLTQEPLAGVKAQLDQRVVAIEDLQQRAQLQREAALLIVQRAEDLSTQSWRQAQVAWEQLRHDVMQWQTQVDELQQEPNWPSVDPKFAPQLETTRSQLLAVWQAFESALALAVAASEDEQAALPAVPVWAQELSSARQTPLPEATAAALDPEALKEMQAKASSSLQSALQKLEQSVAEGQGKTTAQLAAQLRQALKEHGKYVDSALQTAAQRVLTQAAELEGWQRWRADQLRQELVTQAQALLAHPLSGRKQQEALRSLREQWKTSDQGGIPNHALWKQFDQACNEAHKVVEAWLEQLKSQTEAVKAQRRALIAEVQAWASANADNHDWKQQVHSLNQFVQRWRSGGHLGDKVFAQLELEWKSALQLADAPLKSARAQSLLRRQAMIEEAKLLGAQPVLNIAAVKELQQRWQAEAHAVPLVRNQEQKLWDAFRGPIDEAFQRKTLEREKGREQAVASLSAHDKQVLQAAKALEDASHSDDAGAIRAAMQALEEAVRGVSAAQKTQEKPLLSPDAIEQSATKNEASEASSPALALEEQGAEAAATAPAVQVKPAKPLIAMRGDDRHGAKKAEPVKPGRAAKPGDKSGMRKPMHAGEHEVRAPRLGDAAFRAQRQAVEHAQLALKRLTVQAHGQVATRLLSAWELRDSAQVPSLHELGGKVQSAERMAWTQALGIAPNGDASQVLLRLEIAADLPTPAEHMAERRMLQLQLLTKRHDPSPAQTWAQDLAKVFASGFDANHARRVQNVVKVLLGGR